MADLIYTAITSLDGYIEDAAGSFAWAAPDEQVHAFINDTERGVGTYLFGRRMYEVMRVWEHPEEFAGSSPAAADFATIWRAADKIVYSSTLAAADTARTRVVDTFDPGVVAALRESAVRDIGIGGAALASAAIRAGLVDEYRLMLAPVIVGGGKPALPRDVRLRLELLQERRFANGFVFLRYRALD